ncbi:MAG TPA: DUF1501 domain-containing protein [Gemmataceae bacterium]|jgi:uncharacterized protein (DUF1501 family)|nr:DUF1501 domain-containing protein [Gemmataceae bacterium]
MLTRRDLLKTSTLLALAPAVPGFLARTARAAKVERDSRVLVVVELNGGNDGINTVVPFADEGYAKYRKALRLPKDRLLKVDDKVGLHPSLADFARLLEAGQLAIVQGVGYPNPSRSHFQSMATWHTARLDPEEHKGPGWLGRALDATGHIASALLVGGGPPPLAIRGQRSIASAIERIEDFSLAAGADPRKALVKEESADDLTAFVQRSMLDAYSTADRLRQMTGDRDDGRYPQSGLATRLRLIAGLLKAGLGAPVLYTLQPGYDTHSAQLFAHASLLSELSAALKAFLDDLAAAKLADRVAVLVFSEFGRTVAENGSAGTDHGTAGPVFVAGPAVKGGLLGVTPSLLDLDPEHGDLRRCLDFRRVYATVLEDWLGLPAKEVLGGPFERLPLLRS